MSVNRVRVSLHEAYKIQVFGLLQYFLKFSFLNGFNRLAQVMHLIFRKTDRAEPSGVKFKGAGPLVIGSQTERERLNVKVQHWL